MDSPKRFVFGILISVTCFSFLAGQIQGQVDVNGIVFEDSNENGHWDQGERRLSEVLVSNGLDFCLTDSRGEYQLEAYSAEYSFIFVVNPDGYLPLGNFYEKISDEKLEWILDFPLRLAPENLTADFSFVQIADIHIGIAPADMTTFLEDVREINDLLPPPAFVVATGDLVNNGDSLSQYRVYTQAIEEFNLPVYNVIGNHDYQEGKRKRKNYEDFLGPAYYSFNYGKRHFVAIDCVNFVDRVNKQSREQLDWLRKDLALQPPGREIIVLQHYYPMTRLEKWLFDLLSEYNTRAILTGHWHNNRISKYKGIWIIQTPTLRFGGIDVSARGFRVISFQGDELITDEHLGGIRELVVITAPQEEVPLQERLKIEVKAYDVCSKLKEVSYRIDDHLWEKLNQNGKWTWQKEQSIKDLLASPHEIEVKAIFDSGAVVEKKQNFYLREIPLFPPKPHSDWPVFQHDVKGSGATSDLVKPPLYPAWSYTTRGTTHLSSPIVYKDMVYIGTQDDDIVKNQGVIALDARTGELRWEYTTDSSVKCTPAASDDKIYALSVAGIVYALDASTGKEQWTYKLGEEVDGWGYLSPVVDDGVVYTTSIYNFMALDSSGGERLWSGPPMGWDASCLSPALDDERVYIGFNHGSGLFGLDKADGRRKWNMKFKNGHASPCLWEDKLFFAADGYLYELDAEYGHKGWQFNLGSGYPISSPAISGTTLYIGSTDGRVLAIDISSGEELWSYRSEEAIGSFSPYERGGSMVISSPAVSAEEFVYVGANDGNLYCFAARTGEKLWEYNLGAPVTSSPAISGNTVYVASWDGSIYAFVSLASS